MSEGGGKVSDRLVARLEDTWSPAGEARRMRQALLRLWERAEHPAVRVELAVCAAALDRLAGKDAPGDPRRGDLD